MAIPNTISNFGIMRMTSFCRHFNIEVTSEWSFKKLKWYFILECNHIPDHKTKMRLRRYIDKVIKNECCCSGAYSILFKKKTQRDQIMSTEEENKKKTENKS